MKTLSFFIPFMLIVAASFGISNAKFISSELPNGQIHIEEQIITAFAAGDETIQELEVLDSNGVVVFKQTGCYDNVCSYNLDGLGSGGYTAVVTTNQGSFSGAFQL